MLQPRPRTPSHTIHPPIPRNVTAVYTRYLSLAHGHYVLLTYSHIAVTLS